MKFSNKRLFWLLIVLLSLIRFLISYKLPSFYLASFNYDDLLMVSRLTHFINRSISLYNDYTLIKGIIYPIILFISYILKMSYSVMFSMIYILSSLVFILSMKKVINNKIILLLIYVLLLFNPISYSSELFQRLYRNTLSIPLLLLFLGGVINIIYSKKNNIFNYIYLGIIMSIMYLTREDNIWTMLVLVILIIYKNYKHIKIKNILISLIPIIILFVNLNIVSYINYKHYNIYTYNELSKSNFKDAYIKILQIKDDKKINKVAIPKTTLYKLSEVSNVFNLSKLEIKNRYSKLSSYNEEIPNSDMVWLFRNWVNIRNNFKSGKEANEYYKKLSEELDELFKSGKLEKEFVIPSVFIATPTKSDIKPLIKNVAKTIIYTSTYKNIKTYKKMDSFKYDNKIKAYYKYYYDRYNTENIIDNNPIGIEIIRNIYKYFTIVFSFIAGLVYLKNIRKKDKLNLVINIILLIYIVIVGGVAYTHTTAYNAIRYLYLGNVYILQSLFILLNLYRLYDNKKEMIEENRIIFTEFDKAISVVIPAYNEENVIGETIDEIKKVLKKNNIKNEIIIVNDGSNDKTFEIALKRKVIVLNNPCNMGYGYSLKKGIEKASNEIIVITDADNTYPFENILEMLELKKKGYDLVVGRRTGKYYKESIHKSILRKLLRKLVEFVSGKEVKDLNSGLRVFDKSTVIKFFPRLCNTFSFTTSQTLAYLMNSKSVGYVNIKYNKRIGKSKVRLFRDSLISLRYILEACIYYNPLKIFCSLSIMCILLSMIGFIFSHFYNIHAGYILGIGGLLVALVIFAIGILAVLLKQIMDK